MALGSFTWKRSKLKSISTFVIKAIVNAAYDVSRQQSDEDSLFEIRQAIAGLKEYQSNGEESDADSSDDEDFMAPRCRKHPEAGVLVGVCPLCLTVCLTRLAAAEQASSRGGESPEAASPVARDDKAGRSKNALANRGGSGKAASAGPVKAGWAARQQKASAPLAALKEGLPRAGSRKGDRSGAGSDVGTTSARNSFSDRGSANGEGSRRFSRVEVVHQYCARTDFKSSLGGHFSKSKSGRSGGVESGAVEGGASESGGARGVKRSNSNGSASLMGGTLGERRRSSTDSPSRGAGRKSTSGEEISSRSGSGSSSGRIAAVPASSAAYRESGGNLSWVSRWKFRRPADAQSVTKKLSISALVHPDGVTA